MTVFVDQERNPFRRMVMCHLFAETAAELHDMAAAVGLQRSWYQPASFPHYDISLTCRKRAVKNGAVEVDRRDGYEIRKRIRDRILGDPAFAAEWRR